jgi:uracil phosphoribosyltransferase
MTLTSPNTQTSPASLPASVFTLPQTAQLEALYTIIRDKTTSRGDFIFYTDRIIRLLVEEGLNHLPVVKKSVETPTGAKYEGVGFQGRICGVSILRAGEVSGCLRYSARWPGSRYRPRPWNRGCVKYAEV